MHQNIKNNYTKDIDAKLFGANYYDYMLYMGEKSRLSERELDSMAIADFSEMNIVSGNLYSTITWKDAINNGVELDDIGLTAMDNGFISFKKDRITNKEFLDLYLNSKYTIESGDTRLFLSPVTGNSQMFSYPMTIIEDNERYAVFKGGFYQGYFKLYGFDYQTLPDKIDDEFLFHFDIRPRSDYNTDIDTVNYVHPENEGMFFFMGTRAENKFWPFYKFNEEKMKSLQKVNAATEGYFECSGESSYNINKNEVVNADWLEYEPISEKDPCDRYHFLDGDYFADGDRYYIDINDENIRFPILHKCSSATPQGPSTNYLNTYDFKPEGVCGCSKESPSEDIDVNCIRCSTDYFHDDYYNNRCPEEDNGKMAEDKYIGEDIKINKGGYEDSDGHAPNKHGYYDIVTDNQFVMFDRTCHGITTKDYHSGMTVTLQGRQSWPNANYFILMNRTCTGYTTSTIAKYNEDNAYDYNLYKDIRNNVFGLRITKDGAIGYRYGILDCDEENPDRYTLIEEYSKKGVVKTDQWNSINVRFAVINPNSNSKCSNAIKKMRIMFYVNGFLVFISKEIDSIVFKPLNDVYQKQEGVPYSISLGGGSLGLLETILPDYYAITDYILPIERDFCGTFLGDIKSFKIYKGFVDYSAITDYLSKNNVD